MPSGAILGTRPINSHVKLWKKFKRQRGIIRKILISDLRIFASFLVFWGYSSTLSYLSSVLSYESSRANIGNLRSCHRDDFVVPATGEISCTNAAHRA